MGTSQSSGGPGAGVPMVPPWVPDPPMTDSPAGEITGDDSAAVDVSNAVSAIANAAAQRLPVPLAQHARFGGARRSLGSFARAGDVGAMRTSLGRYVRNGYGGSETATRRFGSAAVTAGTLGSVLTSAAAGQQAPGSALDPALLAGRSAQEVMDAVVEVVRPVDGTLDAEAARAAIRDALSELLTRFPEADLLNLDAPQRDMVIERFVAMDVFRQFELDLGRTIFEMAPNAAMALSRLKQVREYVKQSVAASFRKLREAGRSLTAGRISHVVRDALKETFDVFEGYAE